MAARLAAAGWQVRGFDVAAERLELAKDRGIAPVSSSREALEGAELVFSSLPTETVSPTSPCVLITRPSTPLGIVTVALSVMTSSSG